MRIALVSCSKLKMDHLCKARDLYSKSTLFSKATAYIEAQGYDAWFILSAKHGLLHPVVRVSPYEMTLHRMSVAEVKEWSEEVFAALTMHNPTAIDIYAGERYRRYLIPLLRDAGVRVRVPLEGMEIGQQLQFYTEAARATLPVEK